MLSIGCSSSADIDNDQCSSRCILVPFSICFANESLMDPIKDTSVRSAEI